MASSHNPLGFSPLEVNTMNMSFGSSYDMPYGELGYAVSAMMRGLHEPAFRPRFFRMCANGILSFQSWDQMGQDLRNRKVVTTLKTLSALRDLGIWYGGDYSYYKNFDPLEDYSKDPSKLDRFSPNKFGFTKKKKPTRKDILELARRNNEIKKATKQNFYFG